MPKVLYQFSHRQRLNETPSFLWPFARINQVEHIISEAHNSGKRIRVAGNALSPNGIGLSEDTMLTLGQCNRVLHVDENRGTVTVEVRAGSPYTVSRSRMA